MLVEHFLEQSARRAPHKTALVCGERRLTYAEMDQRCNRFAALLRARGVQRGDRVAIAMDNSVEAAVAIFGALKAGAVFMPVNPGTKAAKLSFLLHNSRAAALVTEASRWRTLCDGCDTPPHLASIVLTGAIDAWSSDARVVSFDAAADDAHVPSGRIDVDLAALIYTSGSTGHPKGVMLSHRNVVSAADSITTYLENTADDVILNVLPLSFDYGLYQLLMTFKLGATLVLERSFTYPALVLQRIAAERVTGLPIVPTIAAILLQLDLSKFDLSSLRYVTNTAAALPTRHIQEIRARLPHVRLYSMYGLTECKRVSYLPPEQLDRRPDSVGRGMPNEEVFIVDENGRRLTHGIGELVVRGSNVMVGYWEMPAETDRVLRPGLLPNERVLYSGDIFRMDEEGYLYFVGRKDDIIKTRGEKVSPREVEDVLHACDGVAQAVVVGVPDEILGQAIKAIVALKDGSTANEAGILRHCARHLEDFMVPKFVEFRDALPTTGNGKVRRLDFQVQET